MIKNAFYWEHLVVSLQSRNIAFAPGLTDKEVTRTEALYGFRFPPDLRQLLQYALPISEGFINWRDAKEEELGWRVEEPFLGLLNAVENSFWVRHWGVQPERLADRLRLAQAHMRTAPRLIPIYKNRYLPALPGKSGNPVLSVWAADIIYYGFDLADYFVKEFQTSYLPKILQTLDYSTLPPLPFPAETPHAPYPLRFWDAVMAEWG